MGRSLVAFRDAAGTVRVLDAVCPHFGAHLGHGGEVHDGCIRCPCHKLDFDGDGRCVGAAAHDDPARVRHLRAGVWASVERDGLVWVWHGRDPSVPERPIALDALDWEGWTDPITNDGLCVAKLSPPWLAENIADLAHLRTVHCRDLDRVVTPPGVAPDGTFHVAVDVRWRLGARSRAPRVQRLGTLVNSSFHLDVRARTTRASWSPTRPSPRRRGPSRCATSCWCARCPTAARGCGCWCRSVGSVKALRRKRFGASRARGPRSSSRRSSSPSG